MRSLRRMLLGLAVAGLVVGQVPAAAAAPVVPDPGDLDHVGWTTEFPTGTYGAFAESMASDGRDGMIVSVTTWGSTEPIGSNLGQLWRVGLDGSLSKFGPQVDLSPTGMLMGVAIDEQGRVFVALNNFGSDYDMAEDPPSGVLRVTPGKARRILTLPDAAVPNGLTEREGTLYVTDSTGSLWAGPSTGAPSQAVPWATSPLLAPVSEFGMGANGITHRGGSLYVTSYGQGTIVRIPVRRNGSAGQPTVVAVDEGLVGADGISFDRSGRLWVAVNGELDWAEWVAIDPGRIMVIDPSGAVTLAPTPGGALDYPTQVIPAPDGTLLVANGSFMYGAPNVVALTP